jgi:hypothetical protein
VLPYALVSALVLSPCIWQSRIQAGDLSSHVYNAWLAQLVQAGSPKGLTVAFQATNVLFDWMLGALLATVGAMAAQRIAVAVAVLIFTWGAFAFATVVSGRRPWGLMPAIAMLSYGWVFHSGFFNFYLSLGLCFAAIALAWRHDRRAGLAAILLAVAWLAHGLPVLWSAGILAYTWIAKRLRPAARLGILVAGVTGLALAHAAVRLSMLTQWYTWQFLLVTGVDQVHVFDDKYYLASGGLLLIFGVLFAELAGRQGFAEVVTGVPFHICVLTAAIVAIVPTAIIGRGIQAAFISDRMSLPLAMCVCALLGGARIGRVTKYGLGAVAMFYFALLYRDSRLLNQFEDSMAEAVSRLQAHSRVISTIDSSDLHVNAVTHMIDRVCIGRYFSYANYEASTGEFRVRVTSANAMVTSTYEDSWRMQNGGYVVREGDLPLYAVRIGDEGRITVESLRAGERTEARYWKVLPDLF